MRLLKVRQRCLRNGQRRAGSGRIRLLLCSSLLFAGSLLLLLAAATHAATLPASPPPPAAAAGRLVIGVSPDFDAATVQRLAARYGATVERWLPRLGLALLRVPVGAERATQATLAADASVDFVGEHRQLARIADTPGDEYWDQQWGAAKIQAPAAWDLAWGDPSVVIAVIDTGVNYRHADLESQMWCNPGESELDPSTDRCSCDTPLAANGIDDDGNGYVDDCRGYRFEGIIRNNDPQDGHDHGTFVAGIAAAATNNPNVRMPGRYEGVAGIGRNARIMALRVLNESGVGYTFDIAEAIDYAAANGAQIINLSLTYPPSLSDKSDDAQILQRAVAYARGRDVLVVAASGNEGYPGVSYPAKIAGVLAVGASTSNDDRAYFSNYGARLDLVAPGVAIFGVLRQPDDHTYGYYGGDPASSSGTSFAAPHVAGVAALVRSLRPDLSEAAVHDLFLQTADDVGAAGFDALTGWGRLNAARVVSASLAGLDLAVAAEPSVGVNGRALVQVSVTDPAGRAAGLGARVALSATLGVLSPVTVTLDSRGEASAQFVAGPEPGLAQITATLGALSAAAPLTVTADGPSLQVIYLPLVGPYR